MIFRSADEAINQITAQAGEHPDGGLHVGVGKHRVAAVSKIVRDGRIVLVRETTRGGLIYNYVSEKLKRRDYLLVQQLLSELAPQISFEGNKSIFLTIVASALRSIREELGVPYTNIVIDQMYICSAYQSDRKYYIGCSINLGKDVKLDFVAKDESIVEILENYEGDALVQTEKETTGSDPVKYSWFETAFSHDAAIEVPQLVITAVTQLLNSAEQAKNKKQAEV